MPLNGFLAIESAVLPDITKGANTLESVGEIFKPSYPDSCLVMSCDHVVSRAVDPQSGQPTSKALHNTYKILKPMDKATPMLYQALITPAKLDSVEITLYRNSQMGSELYLTILLEKCYVTSIKAIKANVLDIHPDMMEYDAGDLEEVAFSYKRATWTHNVSNVEFTYDWELDESEFDS